MCGGKPLNPHSFILLYLQDNMMYILSSFSWVSMCLGIYQCNLALYELLIFYLLFQESSYSCVWTSTSVIWNYMNFLSSFSGEFIFLCLGIYLCNLALYELPIFFFRRVHILVFGHLPVLLHQISAIRL